MKNIFTESYAGKQIAEYLISSKYRNAVCNEEIITRNIRYYIKKSENTKLDYQLTPATELSETCEYDIIISKDNLNNNNYELGLNYGRLKVYNRK
ncbi:hypothetical protein [Leeuwenhoekiella sp. CH_XMU1409-2]|uniref:hypothetical protein n=1 Tax=Leeuwenhoekiella sp. CH_XMU1409-2 TaxID=3107768 RepID=UPI0030095512